MKIEELDLTVRPYHILKRAGIDTVEQLQQLSDDDLMNLRNMGVHSLREIKEKVVAYTKNMTIGDRIRAMPDEELARFLQALMNLQVDIAGFCCQNKKECNDILSSWDEDIPQEWCTACMVEALRRPADTFPWEG